MHDMRFQSRNCGEVTLHVAEAGPEGGPLVILLHGFPEFWYGWRHQIGALADAGHHVVVPDQRGYNLSDKPKGVSKYDLDRLVADIVGLADSFNAAQFALAGHDWGAGVAWWLADHYPDRLRRLAIFNAPHPALWRIAMDEDPEQRKLSRYVRMLGTRALPELMIRAGRYGGLIDALRDSKHGLSEEELARYREAWRQRGALTAMINWYRAILKRRFQPPPEASIAVPTQIVWGGRDRYSVLRLAHASRTLCRRGNLTVFPEATHWVLQDESERVNAILLEFLK
jgi:pimeloyl-ACP methyl ester carboxylesterase